MANWANLLEVGVARRKFYFSVESQEVDCLLCCPASLLYSKSFGSHMLPNNQRFRAPSHCRLDTLRRVRWALERDRQLFLGLTS